MGNLERSFFDLNSYLPNKTTRTFRHRMRQGWSLQAETACGLGSRQPGVRERETPENRNLVH